MLFSFKLDQLRRGSVGIFFCAVLGLLAAGCATPSLTGFSDASTTLASAVKTGGELAIAPLATQPVWNPVKKEYVLPGEEEHPFEELDAQWQKRRQAMDAVLVYSASLEAISSAAANRKQNAEALVGAVGQLAESVGYGATAEAGKIVITKGLETIVEVKAWHDMRRAVREADGAIQKLGPVIQSNLLALMTQHQANVMLALSANRTTNFTALAQEKILIESRNAQRTNVVAAISDAAAGAELTRLEGLLATVRGEADRARADNASLQETKRTGREFFESAAQGVEAWARSHGEIAKAFEEKRTPNLALLIARAEEIRAVVEEIKKRREAK